MGTRRIRHHRITVSLADATFSELQKIAELEGRHDAEVARLLLKSGLRAYRRGRPLLCGYPKCSRKGCCRGEKERGQLLKFPPEYEETQ